MGGIVTFSWACKWDDYAMDAILMFASTEVILVMTVVSFTVFCVEIRLSEQA